MGEQRRFRWFKSAAKGEPEIRVDKGWTGDLVIGCFGDWLIRNLSLKKIHQQFVENLKQICFMNCIENGNFGVVFKVALLVKRTDLLIR